MIASAGARVVGRCRSGRELAQRNWLFLLVRTFGTQEGGCTNAQHQTTCSCIDKEVMRMQLCTTCTYSLKCGTTIDDGGEDIAMACRM